MENHKRGFTLIELIVVIAIIAILAAIVMVSVTGYIGKAKDGAVQVEMKQLTTAAQQYYATNGSYDGFCGTDWCDNKVHQCSNVNGSEDFTKLANKMTGYGGTVACMSLPDYQSMISICSPEQWMAWFTPTYTGSKYSSSNQYCVDSTGYGGVRVQQWSICSCSGQGQVWTGSNCYPGCDACSACGTDNQCYSSCDGDTQYCDTDTGICLEYD